MAKGEDALRRKKNKAIRKRMRGDDSSATVSGRIAAIIAAKQRRKNGKRRMCEGMCFSLPTLDDPFNDKHDQKKVKKNLNSADPRRETVKSVTKKDAALRKDVSVKQRDLEKGKSANAKFKTFASISKKGQRFSIQPSDIKGGVEDIPQRGIHGRLDSPSKFLRACLKVLEEALCEKDSPNGEPEHPLWVNDWGSAFLKCSLLGMDILETTGASASEEQIAWMVSVAADIISMKEKEHLSVPNPFLLILVPSQEKAVQVRSLCKPLKGLGIHTVSLHSGASLDHQVHGLKDCEPEFLVSTPERLLELVSVEAIDISGLSFLVIDGLDAFAKAGLIDQLKTIKQSIAKISLTVTFTNSFGPLYTSAAQTLLDKPITRLSQTDSVASRSACISQLIHHSIPGKNSSKCIEIINEESAKPVFSESLKVLLIGETSFPFIAEGYSMIEDDSDGPDVTYSKGATTVTIADMEHIEEIEDLEEYEVVITSVPTDMNDYVNILTGMARQSVNGVLHSFFSEEDAPLAGSLIEILQNCEQNVPEFLKNYCDSVTMS